MSDSIFSIILVIAIVSLIAMVIYAVLKLIYEYKTYHTHKEYLKQRENDKSKGIVDNYFLGSSYIYIDKNKFVEVFDITTNNHEIYSVELDCDNIDSYKLVDYDCIEIKTKKPDIVLLKLSSNCYGYLLDKLPNKDKTKKYGLIVV